jgi:hypothetical protein
MQTLRFTKDNKPEVVKMNLDTINSSKVGSVIFEMYETNCISVYVITKTATVFIVSGTIITYPGKMNYTAQYSWYDSEDFPLIKLAFESINAEEIYEAVDSYRFYD